jgi:hypothetical protein
MIVEQKLVTVADAAKILGRTPKAVRRMYETGKLTPVRIDARVQFRVAELEELIAASEKSCIVANQN